MKKLLIVLILLAGMNAAAQNGHMMFKGIPIDGNLTTFVNKLKQKGFSVLQSENGVAMLKGDFAGQKNCVVGVYEHESKIVNRVVVMFPSKDTWTYLYNDYRDLKDMLTEKYGEPAGVQEEFPDASTYNFNDSDRMHEVRMGRCRYICDWETENGSIELRIDHQMMLGCMVVLLYIDGENDSKVRARAIDDL